MFLPVQGGWLWLCMHTIDMHAIKHHGQATAHGDKTHTFMCVSGAYQVCVVHCHR